MLTNCLLKYGKFPNLKVVGREVGDNKGSLVSDAFVFLIRRAILGKQDTFEFPAPIASLFNKSLIMKAVIKHYSSAATFLRR